MKKLGTVRFSGTSGTRYEFAAYPLETVFKEGAAGVYVITRRHRSSSSGGSVHRRMCTGQSDNLAQPLAPQQQSLSARGANCICVHAEQDKAVRERIERDLLRTPRTPTA